MDVVTLQAAKAASVARRVTGASSGVVVNGGSSVNTMPTDTSAVITMFGGLSGFPNLIKTGASPINLRGIWGGYDNSIDQNLASNIFGSHHSNIKDTVDHASIVGGSFHNIQTSGSYCGIFAGTANTAGGGNGAVAIGGTTNSALARAAIVLGGETNTADGQGAVAIGGGGNGAHGNNSMAGGVNSTTYGLDSVAYGATCASGASGQIFADYSVNMGFQNILGATSSARFTAMFGRSNQALAEQGFVAGREGKQRSLGQWVQANGMFSIVGDAQSASYVLRKQTTDATPTELFLDGASIRMNMSTDTTWGFEAWVSARNTATDTESAFYIVRGAIRKGTNSASATLVGAVSVTAFEDVAAWDCTVTADTTNGVPKITVTGEAAKTINWVARLLTVEVTG